MRSASLHDNPQKKGLEAVKKTRIITRIPINTLIPNFSFKNSSGEIIKLNKYVFF
jgi:hypothetical protein